MREELVDLARSQQGLLTDAQLTHADPDWREVHPGVFAPAVLVLSREQEIEALHLHLERRRARTGRPWSFAGPTAAAMLDLRVPERPPVVVVQGTLGYPLTGARILTARTVATGRLVQGRPVGDVCTAIMQCAAILTRDELVTLVEHAVRRRRCSLEQLMACCRRGVSGSAALRSVVTELSRDGGDRWTRVLLRLLVAAGLARPETERGFPSDVPQIYVDLCWFWLKLAVEVDDWESHAWRDASERDRTRDRWLMREFGVTVLRVTPRQIRDEPDKVVRDIVAAYRQAEQRFGPWTP